MVRIQLKNQKPLVACGFTDGTIRVYQIDESTESMTLCHEDLKVHGFGVNCMDVVVIN